MIYTEIFTDAAGLSRFREVEVPFAQDDPAAADRPVLQADARSCDAGFVRVKAGWDSGWHTAPDDGFAILLRGEVEIEVADGDVRRFAPGDVWRSTDVSGRGHISRVVSEVDAQVYMTHFAPADAGTRG